MAAVPDSHDFTGGVATSSEANSYIRDPIRFLLNRPIAELYQASAQSIPDATFTALTFDAESVDTDPDGTGGHSISSNTSRYTAQYPGWYRVSGAATFAVSAVGGRGTRWAVNGSQLNGSVTMYVNAGAALFSEVAARTMLVFLNVGDYVELQAYQSSGGALNTAGSGADAASMTVVWERNA